MFSHTPSLILLSSLSTIIPFLACTPLIKIHKKYPHLKPLWLFFTFAALTEIIVLTFHFYRQPNAWLIHFYTPIEFILLASILSSWQKNPRAALAIKLTMLLFLVAYFVLKSFEFESLKADTVNYISRPMSLLILMVIALYTLNQVWKSSYLYLKSDYRFWVLSSIVLYNAVSIIVVAFMFIRVQVILLNLSYTHAVTNILHNIFYMLGVFCAYLYPSVPDESSRETINHF